MKKKQLIWIIILFLTILFLSLIVNMPAKQVLRLIKLPPELQIQGLNGTVSKGYIEVLYYQKFSLKNIHFTLQPDCLLKASVCYRLYSEDHELIANLAFNPLTQGISITQSQIRFGSEILEYFPRLLVKPKGQYFVNVENITLIESKLSELKARVNWEDAGIIGEDQILGTYTANIVQQADLINIKLSDQDSLLSVKGDIDIKWGGQYNLDLKLKSRPSLNPSVNSVLEIFAKKTGLNDFSIKRSEQMPNALSKYLQRLKPGG